MLTSLLDIKDMLPEVLSQLSPKEIQALTEKFAGLNVGAAKAQGGADEDIPNLVNANFEAVSKKD